MALSESAAEFGQPDFILVDEISEEAFMANLKKRYEKGKVCPSAVVVVPDNIDPCFKFSAIGDYQGNKTRHFSWPRWMKLTFLQLLRSIYLRLCR